MDLHKIAEEIRNTLEEKRKELELTFIEEDHIYYMKDINGKIRSNFPSVSKVLKKFYVPFDADTKALQMSNGDEYEADILLEKWKKAGDYSTNLGSRVHYELEFDLIGRYNNYKEIRRPIFECDTVQIDKSDRMISGGKEFINLMISRGAVLLDTEIVLGDPELEYTGQPDKVWLMMNKTKDDFGIVVTDWKTNQPKNFLVQPYTGWMSSPFDEYRDTALTHYFIQLPLYAKLLIKMLQNTKFKDVKLLGCVVTHLKEDGTFDEYKVPSEISQGVMQMDIKQYLK
jgi:hypothetical protein